MKTKNKLLFIITILLISVFALSACASGAHKSDNSIDSSPGYYDEGNINEDGKSGDLQEEDDGPNVSEHKIIYKADATIYTDDLANTVAVIQGAIDKTDGEWFDSESISGGYASFRARVKSARLDEFLDEVSQSGTVRNLNKTATNVSLQYQETENRLESLQAEYSRLTQLKAHASMGELLQIEQRQSQISYQINSLQGTLNKYASLLEYSEITLSVYEQSPPADKISFGERLGNVFKGAWKALRIFLEWLVIVIAAVFPFLVVFVPIGAGVTILVLYIKKRRKNVPFGKKTNTPEPPKDKEKEE